MSEKKTFFATNLKYLRLKRNMEQLELANLLGRKSSSSISEWERGKYTPKSGLLSDIAAIFNVSLTDLMEKDLTLENKGVTYQLPQRDLVMISEQLSEIITINGWILDRISYLIRIKKKIISQANKEPHMSCFHQVSKNHLPLKHTKSLGRASKHKKAVSYQCLRDHDMIQLFVSHF